MKNKFGASLQKIRWKEDCYNNSVMGNRFLSKKVSIVCEDLETLLNKRTTLVLKCN